MGRSNHEVQQVGLALSEARSRQKSEVARVEAIIAEILNLQASITSAFWEIGRLLATLRDDGLFRLLGYERFEDLVVARFSFSRPVASRLITVAAELPKPEATKLGQERAYAVIAYVRAAGGSGAIDPVELVRSDKGIVPGKPLSATPVREIMAARPTKPVPLQKRVERGAEATLERGVRRRVTEVGLPRGSVEVKGKTVVVTWTRVQWERLLREE